MFEHNLLFDEFAAAEKYYSSPEAYFAAERPLRAAAVAHMKLSSLQQAMIQHDESERAQAKAKAKRKGK